MGAECFGFGVEPAVFRKLISTSHVRCVFCLLYVLVDASSLDEYLDRGCVVFL